MNKPLRIALTALLFYLWMTGSLGAASTTSASTSWRAKLDEVLPLMGHRNWILVVDSAYPLQTSPGLETLETDADQLMVLRTVLSDLDHSIHVRPIIYTDAELPFVTEQDAPGVSAYRSQLKSVLGSFPAHSLPHEEILQKVEETGRAFHIVILKTRMTIPYTSVFLQLDCKYWSADQEQRLREAMRRAAK
jgi:RbsD / FucU transport protein family